MLIINADDFGRSVMETESAAALVQRGRVTSLSAMVFMADSERAAEYATDLNADIGLHLNFCELWTSRQVPAWLRAHQESLATFFQKSRYALLVYNPGLKRAFDAVYKAELHEFMRLYGRAPSHIDGHRHLHLCANMIIDGTIAPGSSVRRNFTFERGERGVLNRTYRWAIDAYLRRHYALTDYFFSLENCLNGRSPSIRRVADLARVSTVEVMTHPKSSNEFTYLDGEEYLTVLGPVTKGTHAQLPAKGRVGLDWTALWGVLAGLCECAVL